jgi:hypothetical protein
MRWTGYVIHMGRSKNAYGRDHLGDLGLTNGTTVKQISEEVC